MQCRGLGAWGALRFDGLKGKRFSGPFRSRSNRFEDRATSWRRDTALAEGRRICGLCDHTRPWSSDGCNSILTTVVAVVSHHFTTMSPLSHPSGPVYASPWTRSRAGAGSPIASAGTAGPDQVPCTYHISASLAMLRPVRPLL